MTKALDIYQKTPTLSEISEKVIPFPQNNIVLGVALDEQPILFDTSKATSPNTIIWDLIEGQGLSIVKTAIEFVVRHNHKQRIEFVIISDNAEEWKDLEISGLGTWSNKECVAVVPFGDEITEKVFHGLASYCYRGRKANYPVIFFIDEFDKVIQSSESVQQNLRFVLACGRNKGIYTFGTVRAGKRSMVIGWLEDFQAEIYGQIYPNWFELDRDHKSISFFTPLK